MDDLWVIERLEWWVTTARAARVVEATSRGRQVYGFMYERGAHYAELRERSAQTHAIISRVLGSNNVPDLIRRSDNAYWIDAGIEFAEHALAVMVTQAETASKLGSSAPTMRADALHPLIWGAASGRWESGHYSDAVQRAATALSGHVKDQTGRYELGDSQLVLQAFSLDPPQQDRPRLRWPGNDDDLTVRSMREGILHMARGVFSAVRNPASHSIDETPKQEALEQLATLSILARGIEQCELIRG